MKHRISRRPLHLIAFAAAALLTSPLEAAASLPTQVEIERDVRGSFGRGLTACGLMGSQPQVEGLELEGVVVDGDRIIGRATARLSMRSFRGAKRCSQTNDFHYIRTSSGWSYEGLAKVGAIRPSGRAQPIAAARRATPAAPPPPAPATGLPTEPEMQRDLKSAFGSVPAACGRMGSPQVEALALKPTVVGADQIVGQATAKMAIGGLGRTHRCEDTRDFRYIRTSKGWSFEGTSAAGSIYRPAKQGSTDYGWLAGRWGCGATEAATSECTLSVDGNRTTNTCVGSGQKSEERCRIDANGQFDCVGTIDVESSPGSMKVQSKVRIERVNADSFRSSGELTWTRGDQSGRAPFSVMCRRRP
ncbi:MAG: hypothetical protein RIT81_20760 [Deltaproteobacteria bacterium]